MSVQLPRRPWDSRPSTPDLLTLLLPGIGPIASLALLCVAGTLLNPDFATFDNAMNVLTRTAFIGIIAVGMCFVIISGGMDLSVGSMAALIAGCVILLMNSLGTSGLSTMVVVIAWHGIRPAARRRFRPGARPAYHPRVARSAETGTGMALNQPRYCSSLTFSIHSTTLPSSAS